MKHLELSKKELENLRKAHRCCKEKGMADRIKSIYLLALGYSIVEVAEVLLLDEETIRSYLNRYRDNGIDGLSVTSPSGSPSKLSPEELSSLSSHLEEKTYLTAEGIVSYVKKTYKQNYTISGMTDLLHRLGFSYKKAKLVPSKANKQAQEKFVKKIEKLLEKKGENDPLLYIDGVHPQHNTQLAYGWIKKGQEALIKSNSGRERVNLNGALDAKTHKVFVRNDKSVNSQSTVALFKKIERAYPRANIIHMVADNAKYYKSSVVDEYLKDSKIKMHYLPTYSPNLNLIERLWKFMKKKILYNQYYEKFDDFKKAILAFFQYIRKYKSELKSLLTMRFQIIDAK